MAVTSRMHEIFMEGRAGYEPFRDVSRRKRQLYRALTCRGMGQEITKAREAPLATLECVSVDPICVERSPWAMCATARAVC